jgi:hypothetical protein
MATIAIDTYKVIKRLQERGFTKEQAEALVSVAQEVDISNVASKADVQDLRLELQQALYRQTWGLVGAIFAQGAFVIAVLQYLK